MRNCLYLIFVFVIISCSKNQEEVFFSNQRDLSDADFNELLELCDTATFDAFVDFEYRISRIQEIFASNNDNRGAFPTVYKMITAGAIESMNAGLYEDPVYSEKFAVDFSERYMVYLKNHLLGNPIEFHWESYYENAFNGTNITKLVLQGINAHLTIDLTRALGYTGVYPEFRQDWIAFGDNTVKNVPSFLEELKEDYNTDASEMFGLFFVGDIIDGFMGEGTAVNFGFNLLRVNAFKVALWLQHEDRVDFMEKKIKEDYWKLEHLITQIDKMGLTP